MNYKFFLFFFLFSCINYSTPGKNNVTFSSKGFAYIDNDIPANWKNDIFFIAHNELKLGTKIKIINPENKKSLESIIIKKIQYDDFYKILISENVAKKLKLSFDFPYVEILEIKSNESFIAERAITNIQEKKIASKAPIAKININNLNKTKTIKKVKLKNYSILVAEFYSLESAKILKKKLESILISSNYKLIYISKKNDKSYELVMGPYNTINKLKNDYSILNDSGFEDLDIKIND